MHEKTINESLLKFVYDVSDENYWAFQLEESKNNHDSGQQKKRELRLIMQIPLDEVGIITQRFDLDESMVIDIIEWLLKAECTDRFKDIHIHED